MSDPCGVTFVAGGKYTTYRRIAEEALDQVLEFFSLEDQIRFRKGRTDAPLNDLVDEETYGHRYDELIPIMNSTGLSEAEARVLLDRHGRESSQIVAKFGKQARAAGGSIYLALEVLHAIEDTMCLNLADFYLRRVPLFLSRMDHGKESLPIICEIFSQRLSWTKAECEAQIDAVQNHLKYEMAWRG